MSEFPELIEFPGLPPLPLGPLASQQAEVLENARTEIHRLYGKENEYLIKLDRQAKEIAAQAQALERVRKDAERWQYVRGKITADKNGIGVPFDMMGRREIVLTEGQKRKNDRAIDAANAALATPHPGDKRADGGGA